jgi:hypothetical protein
MGGMQSRINYYYYCFSVSFIFVIISKSLFSLFLPFQNITEKNEFEGSGSGPEIKPSVLSEEREPITAQDPDEDFSQTTPSTPIPVTQDNKVLVAEFTEVEEMGVTESTPVCHEEVRSPSFSQVFISKMLLK